jgi:hypothetical protein
MKTSCLKLTLLLFILSFVFLFVSCDKDDDTNKTMGVLKFETLNPLANSEKINSNLKTVFDNPALTGDTTETLMTSIKMCIGDVWVSQDIVKAGNSDDLDWVRLTNETNQLKKLFEEYSFPAKEIPAGNYKSIKITFKNVFYRHVVLASDNSVVYELLETMGSWTDECDENDESWAKTNYFSVDGNHYLNENGVFELVSEGEKIGGFTLEADKTASLKWRLGAGATETCTNYLIDVNGNRVWDCGVDYIEDVCPPDMEYMWDFVVEYE